MLNLLGGPAIKIFTLSPINTTLQYGLQVGTEVQQISTLTLHEKAHAIAARELKLLCSEAEHGKSGIHAIYVLYGVYGVPLPVFK